MKRPTALILIIIALALFFTFTSSEYDSLKEKRELAAEYRNVIDNVERITQKRDELLLEYNSIPKSEIDRLFKILPDNVDSVRLVLDLDTIASRYGISVDNVRVETKADDGRSLIVLPEYGVPYEKVTVSFSFVSNYQGFTQFLADLERSLRIMDIRSATFQVSDAGLYEHKLVIDTYWLK